MLELFYSRPARLKQMRNGPLSTYLDALAARLHAEGYRPTTARHVLGVAGDFNRMLGWRGIEASGVAQEVVDDHLARLGEESGDQTYRNSLEHLFQHLRQDGFMTVVPREKAPPKPFADLVEGYAVWMRRVQGLAESTISTRTHTAERFLSSWHAAHPRRSLDAMTARDVLTYIREHDLKKSYVSDLRTLCRYMYATEVTSTDLSLGVPRLRHVKLARPPKHITWDDVGRMLDATSATTASGLRDRAVVMLSAELGLRNNEIRSLELDHIQWRRGIINVLESKGGKSRNMPLPEATGQAVADYICYGRPYSTRREVFLRHSAPGGRLSTPNAVSGMIRRLAADAGVALPQGGQNVLRHSLATHLVNNKVSIKAIADLLGHSSINTTAIYTLVDMTTLARVAQPFPEEVIP